MARTSASSLRCLGIALVAVCATGCAVHLRHVPSADLNSVKAARPAKIMVADGGDARGVSRPEEIGFGFSYWLPQRFTAEDDRGPLPVSHYIARSLSEDLTRVGYDGSLAGQGRQPMLAEAAMAAAKKAGVDYLAISKVNDAKTNFWGFLFIPFVEPVWTRVNLTIELVDAKTSEKSIIRVNRKRTEWNFAKVTIFDAIFDAALFGRMWHARAWGRTVVSDALADAVQKISVTVK